MKASSLRTRAGPVGKGHFGPFWKIMDLLDCFKSSQPFFAILNGFGPLSTFDQFRTVFRFYRGHPLEGEGKGKSNAPLKRIVSLLFRSYSVPLLESRFTISRQGKRVSHARGQKYYFSILSPTIYIYLRIKFKLYGRISMEIIESLLFGNQYLLEI